MIELTEAEVKKGVEDYLQIAINQGRLWFERMNAGDFIEVRGDTRRRIKGARKGTADYIVILKGLGPHSMMSFVIFIEVKSTKGKQKPEQKEFEEMITRFNCQYEIVRSVDELEQLLV